MHLLSTAAIVGAIAAHSIPAHASCNTRAGFVSNQPPVIAEPDREDDPERPLAIAAPPPLAAVPPVVNATRYDGETIRIDLSRDMDSLLGFRGRYTSSAPVIGMRLENVPGYDSKRHCNAIQPIVYKPRVEHLADGRVRAWVDKNRFSIEFDPRTERRSFARDPDPSGRFFWIFPDRFGGRGLPKLTQSYDAAFRKELVGSDRRRWVAEAYFNITLRYYRLRALNQGFPTGWRPSRDDLSKSLLAKLARVCDQQAEDLDCLASRLIEVNEAAPPGNQLAREAFMVGDALLENSGISTGVRQLDFGGSNRQARALAVQLFPTTPGMARPGYGYRRPIRAWDIDVQNRWFDADGKSANSELSRDEAKRLLLSSHADFLQEAALSWQLAVDKAYPLWPSPERTALAVIAIDLENVSGYILRLAPTATKLCDVLLDPTVVHKRSNWSIARGQRNRVVNGRSLMSDIPSMSSIDWECINDM